MTPTRVATVLLALAAVVVGALLLAVPHYNDDAAEQPWQFEVGMAIFRHGFPVVLLATIVALIWMRRSDGGGAE